MATPREVRLKLESMSDEEQTAFNDEFPFDGQARSPAGYERLFYDQPVLEGAFCRLLGLSSEGEKVTQASLDSAEAAKLCAQASLDSARWARVAGICSLVALGVSVASLLR
ncbi:MAG: hypothetical protein P4L84_18755 [Isosphaeraceae bacterium]|nr:hypothetical protein [Isosphaeraceae bacterium]